MYVGPRVIEGQIREREVAKRLYEEAKATGRKASLLEQERPNIFTSSIANVGPNESIDVTIEFQDTVPFDGAQFALRFPLVVAPRYVPGDDGECDGRAGGLSMTVADGDRISPPLSAAPAVNPARVGGGLRPVFALRALDLP